MIYRSNKISANDYLRLKSILSSGMGIVCGENWILDRNHFIKRGKENYSKFQDNSVRRSNEGSTKQACLKHIGQTPQINAI